MERYWELKIQLPNAENQKVVNEYLLSLKVANRSFYTINNYRIFYQTFFKEEKASYAALTSDHIQKWLIQNDTGLKKNSIKFHISALSTFYKFCVEEEYIKKSPIKKRWYPRAEKPIPKYLTKEETSKIRRLLEDLPLRDRVIFEFTLTSGCRIGEVHRLDKADIDFENRTTRVGGKGKKIRQVHFSEMTALLLERYLQSRKDDHPALFVTHKEPPTRLSANWVGRSMRNLGEKAELPGSLHPHRLRHTFATVLLAKGADIMFIADELGHSDIKTTQIYARLPKQQIISMYRKYMG
ncbi:tyrosine-type recombinase/integrase [Sporosarcina oncorhynchi]|uniref:Tyrosine-type recombinase/integrase n=1 Tax=Sporosarcina oncorhynchi TaxID=3056444 RepID=A0ABZ0L650_9BACL|nr:tyrosine-type recombinase/integrase [Sporosarcina sp. T2O-4]WOV88044.1 tyrosine-type recombinase/integrase [Sporosarcina sp. T2O-4]